MTENLLQKFLTYVKIYSQSDHHSDTNPTSSCQIEFAKFVKEECLKIGLTDVELDEKGYLMATLPANITDTIPTIGFIAHLDTAPDFCGKDVKPQIISNYTGDDIILNASKNIVLSPKNFPVLNTLKGETLITTDGTTLLGADDKSGIAEILTAMEYLITHPEVPHGTVRICFTPDEEVGQGADYFDTKKFGAEFAYTVDGGDLGELQAENFYAAGAKITFHGSNVHPGSAKDKMKNSITIASLYHNRIPEDEVPEKTCDREGFYHLGEFNGTVEETVLEYIIRDFDKESFEKRKVFLAQLATEWNMLYGQNTVVCDIHDQYSNMHEILQDYPQIIALAEKAMKNLNIAPKMLPIRGGTDGARLSFMGLPCPNLFTGGYNFHGKYEFAVLSQMELACQTIIEIIKLNAIN